MAYLTSTILNDFQAREATNEKKFSRCGMLDLAKDSTPFVDYIPPSVQQMLATLPGSRLAKIPVLKDQTVTVVTTPGFGYIPTNLGETAAYSFAAYDVFSGFRMYPASFEDNQIDAEFYRTNVLKNVLNQMAITADGIVATNLAAQKTQVCDYATQVSQGDGAFTFNAGTDTLEIAKAATKEAMFYNLMNLMAANKMPGEYRIVGSPAWMRTSEMLAFESGPNNSKNLIWSNAIIPSDRRYESDQISPASDIFTGYMVRDGAIGIYENFPYDFRNGTTIAGKSWSISDVELPFLRMRANIFINNEATDATALIGATNTNAVMTTFEEMAIWSRFYVVYPYNSDLTTKANPILKITGKTT
jgi:hypothetical protein